MWFELLKSLKLKKYTHLNLFRHIYMKSITGKNANDGIRITRNKGKQGYSEGNAVNNRSRCDQLGSIVGQIKAHM